MRIDDAEKFQAENTTILWEKEPATFLIKTPRLFFSVCSYTRKLFELKYKIT
jgi:hypothetical protein